MSRNEDILKAFRETAWIAFCYNDHNFKPEVLKEKAKAVCAAMGVKSLEDANKILAEYEDEQIDARV